MKAGAPKRSSVTGPQGWVECPRGAAGGIPPPNQANSAFPPALPRWPPRPSKSPGKHVPRSRSPQLSLDGLPYRLAIKGSARSRPVKAWEDLLTPAAALTAPSEAGHPDPSSSIPLFLAACHPAGGSGMTGESWGRLGAARGRGPGWKPEAVSPCEIMRPRLR